MTSIKVNLKEIVKSPLEYGNMIEIPILIALLRKANDYYFNSDKVIFVDDVYDILKDCLDRRAPDSKILKMVGSGLDPTKIDNDKYKLPYHMGSMSKIKELSGIKLWLSKYNGPYVISDKLDGVSGLLVKKDNILKLYSRGNSEYGRDISPLLEYLNIPNLMGDYVVRGELIMSKTNFDKYSEDYSIARSLVNGICRTGGISNSSNMIPERVKDMDFVGYELIYPIKKPLEQFEILRNMGFKTANTTIATITNLSTFGLDSTMEGSYLFNILIKHRVNSDYDIDGIIITDNKEYDRNVSGNPDYSFAFKVNGVGKDTEVIDVEWNPSKHGQIIPRIKVKPIDLDGNKVQHTTGFNAKYILKNKIGPGAILKLVRSGEVIPHIIEVVKCADKAKLPDIEYEWTSTNVHIVLKDNIGNNEYKLKRLISFFRCLSIDNISRGTLSKLVENGYDSIEKILNMIVDDFLKLPGIKITMATKLYNNIHKVIDYPISIEILMTASLKFGHGFGVKRFKSILNRYPDILDLNNVNVDMIADIPGFQTTTAKQFVKNLSYFKVFLDNLPMLKLKSDMNKLEDTSSGNLFSNSHIVMTGFRDSIIEEFILLNGGNLCNTITKKTKLLIAKDINSNSSKIDAANNLGIETTSLNDFRSKYNI